MGPTAMSPQAAGGSAFYSQSQSPMQQRLQQDTHQQSQQHMPQQRLSDSRIMPPTASTRFEYSSERIVMAAGQYREVRPSVLPTFVTNGAYRFHTEPAELPPGLQLDPATGIIWGTPLPPMNKEANQAALGGTIGYSYYTVTVAGPSVKASTRIGIKVVHFLPTHFKITHVSQLDHNKYMVLVDTRRPT